MFYRYSRDKNHELHIKQIINPYTTLLLSSSSIKNIRLLILICSWLNRILNPFQITHTEIGYVLLYVFESSSRLNYSVTQLSNKMYKANFDWDMLNKERTGSINNNYVRNKNIKLLFDKKNEEIKINNLTTKEFFEKDNELCNKHINNVFNGSIANLPNNDSHITHQSCTIKLNKSRNIYNLVQSSKCDLKVRWCSVNDKIKLEKVSTYWHHLISNLNNNLLDIDLSSDAIKLSTITL